MDEGTLRSMSVLHVVMLTCQQTSRDAKVIEKSRNPLSQDDESSDGRRGAPGSFTVTKSSLLHSVQSINTSPLVLHTTMATLTSLPDELLTLIIHHLNAHPAPRSLLPGIPLEDAWKAERLLFSVKFDYCVCDHCASAEDEYPPLVQEGRRDVPVFPLPVKDSVNSVSRVCRRFRGVAVDASRRRSVMHLWDDIERSMRGKEKATAPEKNSAISEKKPEIPNLPTKSVDKAKPPITSAATQTKPPTKAGQSTPRHRRRLSMTATHATDGTPIEYTFTSEEEESIKAEWERHLHGISYPSEEDDPQVEAARLKEEWKTIGPILTLPDLATALPEKPSEAWNADGAVHDNVRYVPLPPSLILEQT
jgi:hypothetical protein